MSDHRLFLHPLEGEKRKAYEPYEGSDYAYVIGGCPACGHSFDRPEYAGSWFRVSGTGRRIASDDRHYEADALGLCCKKPVGLLRYKSSTLFGLREDEAVFRSYVKIY